MISGFPLIVGELWIQFLNGSFAAVDEAGPWSSDKELFLGIQRTRGCLRCSELGVQSLSRATATVASSAQLAGVEVRRKRDSLIALGGVLVRGPVFCLLGSLVAICYLALILLSHTRWLLLRYEVVSDLLPIRMLRERRSLLIFPGLYVVVHELLGEMLAWRALVDVAALLWKEGNRPLRPPEGTDRQRPLEVVEVHILHTLWTVPDVVGSAASVVRGLKVAILDVEGQSVRVRPALHG